MIQRIISILVLCVSLSLAKNPPASAPATRPATQPTTQRTHEPEQGDVESAAAPATAPANLKVAYFDLARPIVEKPADFSFFSGEATTLRALVNRITQAGQDKSIRAILVTLGAAQMNLAQAQEIRDALAIARRNGKETFAYADSYDTIGYTLVSGCNHICLLEGGEIMMPGVSLEATFAKGLLDKVGVKADYVQIGEYKGADEQFTRTEPSDELRGELNKLTEALYKQVVSGISLNRNLPKDDVRQAIDQALLGARAAKDRGLVDHLLDVDGMRGLMAEELGREVDLLPDYGKPASQGVDFSNPFAFFALLAKRPAQSNKPAIALIHATGMIVDGSGGTSLFGGSAVGSDDIRKAFRTAARDDSVKAIVLRIDSPGGSAVASEAMWQAARRAGEKKPVIVSIGSMAASGGYYLASCSDTIYADPSAIVGSIGVVGGKFVLKDLYEKIGLSTESFRKGRNADLFSNSSPFTDRQRKMLTGWMKQTYDLFTERVMVTRKNKIDDIDQVARGRIFIASEAKKLGMVDELGGLDQAITAAAEVVELKPDEYEVRTLPAPKTLADFFNGSDPDTSFNFSPQIKIGEDSILNVLPVSTRQVLGQTIQSLQLLQDRPVVLVSPWILSVK